LITGLIVAIDKKAVTHVVEKLHSVRTTCVAPVADIPVSLELPSGTLLQRRTSARGQVAFSLPLSEPARGVAAVRSGSAESSIVYEAEDRTITQREIREKLNELSRPLRDCGRKTGTHGQRRLE